MADQTLGCHGFFDVDPIPAAPEAQLTDAELMRLHKAVLLRIDRLDNRAQYASCGRVYDVDLKYFMAWGPGHYADPRGLLVQEAISCFKTWCAHTPPINTLTEESVAEAKRAKKKALDEPRKYNKDPRQEAFR